MNDYVLVAVSPFYNGRGWTDSATGISFEPKLFLHPTRISKKEDLRGIQNSVRMNNLLLLEGSFDQPAGEVSVAHVNPEELTKEQFDVLVSRLKESGDDGISQEDLDAVRKEKEAVEADLTEALSMVETVTNEKAAVESNLSTVRTELSTAESKLTAANASISKLTGEKDKALSDLSAANSKISSLTTEKEQAQTELSAVKTEFYSKYTFTETELNGFTVAKIKEILDAKGIAYTNETKADLIAKLIAPAE